MVEVYGPNRLPSLPPLLPVVKTVVSSPANGLKRSFPPLGAPKPMVIQAPPPPLPAVASNEDAKLRKAAQEFEAVFVNQLLQQMDKTIDRSESLLNGGQAEDTFRGMMLQEVANSISMRPGGSGFGFAEAIYKQMKPKLNAASEVNQASTEANRLKNPTATEKGASRVSSY